MQGRPGGGRYHADLHRHVFTPRFPLLSTRYDIELYAKPGYGASAHAAAPFLALALSPAPLSLPPWGVFYLHPALVLALPPLAIAPAAGRGVLPIARSPPLPR